MRTERDSLQRELEDALDVETRIAALLREREGYTKLGKDKRAEAVDAELRQLRGEGRRSADEIRRRLRELEERPDAEMASGYAAGLRREREDCLRRGFEARAALIDAELERVGYPAPVRSTRRRRG